MVSFLPLVIMYSLILNSAKVKAHVLLLSTQCNIIKGIITECKNISGVILVNGIITKNNTSNACKATIRYNNILYI